MPISDQPLPHPWFLFPEQSELADEEFEDLVETVRDYLLRTSHCTVRDVRNRMEALGPETNLPLLYLMRYVAFREAGSHNYWPHFRKILFGDVLTYNDVAIGLASTTARLWQSLYLHTKGSLYFPHEGPVNIKWPLAHAGLLPDHKAVLREFGLDLLAADGESGDLFAETMNLGGQEFGLRYWDWVREHPRFQNHSFSTLVLSTRRNRLIIIELAQKWLEHSLPELEEALREVIRPRRGFVLPRRFLVYRADSNQLGIMFRLGRLPGRINVQLNWNDRTLDLQYRDFAQNGEREFMDEFLPVTGQKWSPDAQLILGGNAPIETRLPTLKRQSGVMPGVVFDPVTGAQTKHWRLDQEYFVLVDAKALAKTPPNTIFVESFDLGTPRGEWPDYRMLWVRTRSPEDIAGAELSALQALEVATDKLALPSFEQQLRPRFRLVGGKLKIAGPDGVMIYDDAEPPHLEVTGRWTTDFDVVLLHRPFSDHLADQREVAKLHMSAPAAGTSRIVALWEDCRWPGMYTLKSGDEEVAFQLLANTIVDTISISEWRLDLKMLLSGTAVENLSRHALDDASLSVQTWPGAELQLVIKDQAGGASACHSIQSDNTGTWQSKLVDLAINWARFAPGDLILEVTWRGLFTRQITITDTSFISAGALKTAVRPVKRRHFSFVCTGVVRGHPAGEPLVGYLLPQLPWTRQAHQFELTVGKGGRFSGETTVKWKPAWLLIGNPPLLTNVDSRLIVIAPLLNGNQHSAQPPKIMIGQDCRHVKDWSSLAKSIVKHAYPPELTPYIAAAPIMYMVKRLHPFLANARKWRSIRHWEEWEKLIPTLQTNADVALFWRRVPNGINTQDVVYATITSKPESYQSGKLFFKFRKDSTTGSLVKTNYGGSNRIALKLKTTLRACTECHVIMPYHAFDHHRAPFTEYPDCTSKKATYFDYVPGPPDPLNSVSVAVLWNIIIEIKRFQNYLLEVLKSKQQPDLYKDLFEQFKTLIPKGVAPVDWLAGLANALGQLIRLGEVYRKRQPVTLAVLSELVKPLIDYEDALLRVLAFMANPPVVKTQAVKQSQPPAPKKKTVPAPASTPSKAPDRRSSEPSKERLKSSQQAYVVLTARDRNQLDDAQRHVTKLLEKEFLVKGPYRLPDLKNTQGVFYRLYLSVPMLAQYATVLKHLKLSPGVQCTISGGFPV